MPLDDETLATIASIENLLATLEEQCEAKFGPIDTWPEERLVSYGNLRTDSNRFITGLENGTADDLPDEVVEHVIAKAAALKVGFVTPEDVHLYVEDDREDNPTVN